MLRRFGLLAGMLLGLIMVVGEAAAQDVSVFTRKKVMHKNTYGFQIIGGGGTYTMGDINDYRHVDNWPENDEDAVFGVGYGAAILYRAQEHVRFAIGFNVLGQDKTYIEYAGEEFEQTVSGGELYFQAEYLVPFNEDFNVSLNFGPAVYSGSLDRSGTVGTSFADATGRAFGLRAGLGAQFLFSDRWGLHLMGGFRMAKIGEVSYEDRNGIEQIVYWNNNRRVELDFTGAFVELGLRMYFEPATDWMKF